MSVITQQWKMIRMKNLKFMVISRMCLVLFPSFFPCFEIFKPWRAGESSTPRTEWNKWEKGEKRETLIRMWTIGATRECMRMWEWKSEHMQCAENWRIELSKQRSEGEREISVSDDDNTSHFSYTSHTYCRHYSKNWQVCGIATVSLRLGSACCLKKCMFFAEFPFPQRLNNL